MNPQNGKNTNITNKKIQIGDLVKHATTGRLGIVLDISLRDRVTEVTWVDMPDYIQDVPAYNLICIDNVVEDKKEK